MTIFHHHYKMKASVALYIAFTTFIVLPNPVACAGSVEKPQINSTANRPPWLPPSVPDISEWATSSVLPTPRAYAAAAASSNNLYVAGGFRWDTKTNSVIYYDDVLSAHVRTDGKLEKWESGAKFQNGRTGLGIAIVKNTLFIAGGSWSESDKPVYADDVQAAHVGTGGTISKFTQSSHHLNTPRSNFTLLGYTGTNGSYLYAIGGVTQMGGDTVHLNTIEYAPIDQNGDVGLWKTAHFDLKGGRSSPQALIIRDTIYVIGGWGDLDYDDIYNDIQYAKINKDGSISPWHTSVNHLPFGIYGHSTCAVPMPNSDGALFIVCGGQPSTGNYSKSIEYAYVVQAQTPTYSVGPWTEFYKTLPEERAGHAFVFFNDYLYLIGGTQAGGIYLDSVIFSRIGPGSPD